MHTKSIKQLSTLLQNKEISAVALATHFLDRIEADNSNAFLHVDRALTLAQAAAADARIAAGTATPLTGVPIAHKDLFVTQGWRTTAVVTGSDLVALGCYDAIRELGLSCPEDISVVGHNDMPYMDMIRPPLTTIRIRHHGIGTEAARLILQTIASPDSPVLDVRLKPELVVRESTAAPKG